MVKHLRTAALFPFFVLTIMTYFMLYCIKEFSWRFNHWCWVAYSSFDRRSEKLWKPYVEELRGLIGGK